jgi:DNA-binding transcriptional MerR regulator
MLQQAFKNTSRRVSVQADCQPSYVTRLAKEGLLPFVMASDGTRLYTDEAAQTVRQLKAQRMAHRGRGRG